MSALPARLTLAERITDVDRILSLLEVLDREEEMTDDLRASIETELSDAISGTKKKVDDTCAALAALEAASAAAAAEEKRLRARRERFDHQIERLESYVVDVLINSERREIQGVTSSFALRLNPPCVAVEAPEAVPAEYLRLPAPPLPAPDKAAIVRALKAGIEVPGCRLAQSVRLVRS